MIPVETVRSFGATLKAAREEKQRSLDDVSRSIRVNRHHLEAIEAGELEKLPQGPYALAFIREYAKAMNIALPPELAPVPSSTHTSPKDPKVVSRPHSAADRAPLTQVARETARFAKTAAKTVSKTTENVVNMVESGGKEALEVLTSKNLWDEAEGTRRERLGLPPIERPVEAPPKRIREDKPLLGSKAHTDENDIARVPDLDAQNEPATPRHKAQFRVSKRATNVVILLLVVVFGAAAYFAIRMSKKENGNLTSKDYIPAPVETPPPLTRHPTEKAVMTASAAPATVAPTDSLKFTLRATQPVWVSIAPDGIPAYRGELKPGESHTFRAADKFVVNIGNQKSVVMTFDGEPLSGLPAVQNSTVVVRDLVLMRDHVLLNGNPVNLALLTHMPAPPPVSVTPVKSIVAPPNPAHTSVPTTKSNGYAKSAASKSSANSSKNNSKNSGKLNQSKPSTPAKSTATKSKKPAKFQYSPELIHPVEPIPPRP